VTRYRTRLGWAIALASVATSLHAQQTIAAQPASDRSADATADVLLSRPISITLEGVSLRQALDGVAAAGHVEVEYRSTMVKAYHDPVTLHAEKMPLGMAFEQILKGTGLRLIPLKGVLFGLAFTGRVEAQATGSVTGRVVDAGTNRPIADATVTIDSLRPVRTRDNGMFTVADVPAGVHKVVVRMLGYRSATTPVTVKEGSAEVLRIVLTASAAVLNDVVTTATGDRRRLEVGNAIGTINVDSVVKTTLIRNVSDLLQARVPGVVVQNTSGEVGAPSRIRIRGINSLTLNNDPIVIIDGIRMNAMTTQARNQTYLAPTSTGPRLGGADGHSNAPSRLDDIDPSTIESIDVLRGPSASSLYGSEAANGVIVIKTKRGHVGPWRLNLSGDNGWSAIQGDMPDTWWGFGKVLGRVLYSGRCLLAVGGEGSVAGHTCVQDSVRNFNYENDPNMRTLGTGTTRVLRGDLSGGSENLQQFFSFGATDNVGMAKMSDAQQRLVARLWSSPAPSWMLRPNTQQNIDGSSRTTFHPTPLSSVSLTAQGIYNNVLNGGSAVLIPEDVGQGMSPSDTLGFLPSNQQRTRVASLAKRGLLSSSGDYTPWPWLSGRATVGGDYSLRTDGSDLRAQDCTSVLVLLNSGPNGACPSGRYTGRYETFVRTAHVDGEFKFSPWSWLMSRTSFGEDYTHTNATGLNVGSMGGCNLAFGSTLLTPNPVCQYGGEAYVVQENRDEAATAGVFVEQSVSLFGLFVTTGIRRDVSSGFGGQVNRAPPSYPKFDLSYPISEQSFFPKSTPISMLRLRLAYGQSGNVASQIGLLNTYEQQREAFGGSSSPTALINVTGIGNADLKPERGTEWEGGFDVSFFDRERLGFEFTIYRKYTRDAINQLQLPYSYGLTNNSQYVNLGNVENRGLEGAIHAQLLDSRAIAWNVSINASKHTNKLVHKAPGLGTNGPESTTLAEGYPLFGFWGVSVLSYSDANHDGILDVNEVVLGPRVFLGSVSPRGELTYTSSLSLLNGTLQIQANFDHVIGQTTDHSSFVGAYPRGAVDPTAPLGAQAAWIQAFVNGGGSIGGDYFTQTSTLRFNELSVTYNVPPALVQRVLRAHSLGLTLAARNLAIWTNYVGKDPNINSDLLFRETNLDGGTGVPQPRQCNLRFNLGL